LRYHPADASLAELVDELRSTSPFDTAWRTPTTVAAHENRAVFRHPDGADITLDGNLLEVPGDDLTAVVLTAVPGSTDHPETLIRPGRSSAVREHVRSTWQTCSRTFPTSRVCSSRPHPPVDRTRAHAPS
jgi:hypothetical protein